MILFYVFYLFALFGETLTIEVIWAVNCGGDTHVDVNKIKYGRDMLAVGTASNYGKSMVINRVPMEDQILYQTERYHTANFGYDIPIPDDGNYVLLLKFSEVWFAAPNQKVFDVVLNGEHAVIEHLDIFSKVGRGVAHDEIIPFQVKTGKIFVNGESSDLYFNKIQVEFIKGDYDNPKVNAIVLFKGSHEEVPRLPPLPEIDNESRPGNFKQRIRTQEDEQPSTNIEKEKKRERRLSGPKTPDPYAADETSSTLIPILVAVGAFLPIVFFLCKL